MVCRHLKALETALLESGEKVTYRGQVWTENCREWVYFNVVLDIPEIRKRFELPECVQTHENLDQRSGTERGLECTTCHDAIVGLLEGTKTFP